jgi:hypothetical protein
MWQPPDPDSWNGALLGYVIRYRLADYSNETLHNVTVPAVARQIEYAHELTDLIVFQGYEIGVAAFNNIGVGVYSGYIRSTTKEGRPTSTPLSVTASAVNSSAILLSWLPPDPRYVNGINQGYKIFVSKLDTADSTPQRTLTVPSNLVNPQERQSTYISALDKFSTYSIQVLCFTAEGDGPKSQSVRVQTLEDGELLDLLECFVNVCVMLQLQQACFRGCFSEVSGMCVCMHMQYRLE